MAEVLEEREYIGGVDEVPNDLTEITGGYESFLGSLTFGGFETSDEDTSDEETSDEETGDEETSNEDSNYEEKDKEKNEENDEENDHEESNDEETDSEKNENSENKQHNQKNKKDPKDSKDQKDQKDQNNNDEIELESELLETAETFGGKIESKFLIENDESNETPGDYQTNDELSNLQSDLLESTENKTENFEEKIGSGKAQISGEDIEVVNSEFLSEDPDLGDKPIKADTNKLEILKGLVNDNPDTSSEDDLESEFTKSRPDNLAVPVQPLITQEQKDEITKSSESSSESSSSSESDDETKTKPKKAKSLPKKIKKKLGGAVFTSLQAYLN